MALASATLAGMTDWEPAMNPASSKIRTIESSAGLASLWPRNISVQEDRRTHPWPSASARVLLTQNFMICDIFITEEISTPWLWPKAPKCCLESWPVLSPQGRCEKGLKQSWVGVDQEKHIIYPWRKCWVQTTSYWIVRNWRERMTSNPSVSILSS